MQLHGRHCIFTTNFLFSNRNYFLRCRNQSGFASRMPTGDCESLKHERNILRIVINNNDEIMVENEQVNLADLKEATKAFLDNNGDGTCLYCNGNKFPNASDNPEDAVVSLQNGQQTTYKQFVAVQNELSKLILN